MMPCADCGRSFGGVKTYDMHHLVRAGRCRSDAELRRIGIAPNGRGIWVRRGMWFGPLQLRLFKVSGRRHKAPTKIRVPSRCHGWASGRDLRQEVLPGLFEAVAA